MEPYIQTPDSDTPEIIFDPQQNIFKISNISVPEDAYEFYRPVIEWINEYAKNPLPETVIDMNLEYVNSASSKQIIQVLLALEAFRDKSKITINWYYEAIDEDMQTLGERFASLAEINFNFIEV